MQFCETKLPGAFLIRIEPRCDERGFFARTWCCRDFAANGLNPALAQCSISFNTRRGTLRGMHYQAAPHQEVKLVRCTRGAIYDVIVDLRESSPTFKKWIGIELTPLNHEMLYVPEGFAHGFLTLEDDTEVFYQMSQFYQENAARGVRWNDPTFSIEWPMPVEVISDRDANYPSF